MSKEKFSSDAEENIPNKQESERNDEHEFRIFSTEDLRREFLENLYGEEYFSVDDEIERKTETQDSQYKYFDEFDRRELYQAFKNTGEYIRENNIADIIFIDRSARGAYIGIKEYLKNKYPGQPQPNVFFVNPRGFSLVYFDDSPASLRMRGFASSDEKYGRIDKRFEEAYPKLVEDKEKPVLLFDACIHRGTAMVPIITSLRRIGFQNVKTGVYQRFGFFETIPIDFTMISKKGNNCSPFELDDILSKNADVTSRVNPTVSKEDYQHVAQIRFELAQLVRDGISSENK